jgi:hypothetical protein
MHHQAGRAQQRAAGVSGKGVHGLGLLLELLRLQADKLTGKEVSPQVLREALPSWLTED